jgi:hypothetical protein
MPNLRGLISVRRAKNLQVETGEDPWNGIPITHNLSRIHERNGIAQASQLIQEQQVRYDRKIIRGQIEIGQGMKGAPLMWYIYLDVETLQLIDAAAHHPDSFNILNQAILMNLSQGPNGVIATYAPARNHPKELKKQDERSDRLKWMTSFRSSARLARLSELVGKIRSNIIANADDQVVWS